ncbi:hypothetical protein QOT17_019950 [Balamuthia mandrillaris]
MGDFFNFDPRANAGATTTALDEEEFGIAVSPTSITNSPTHHKEKKEGKKGRRMSTLMSGGSGKKDRKDSLKKEKKEKRSSLSKLRTRKTGPSDLPHRKTGGDKPDERDRRYHTSDLPMRKTGPEMPTRRTGPELEAVRGGFHAHTMDGGTMDSSVASAKKEMRRRRETLNDLRAKPDKKERKSHSSSKKRSSIKKRITGGSLKDHELGGDESGGSTGGSFPNLPPEEAWKAKLLNRRSVLITIENLSKETLVRKGAPKLPTGTWAKEPPAAVLGEELAEFGSYGKALAGTKGSCAFTIDNSATQFVFSWHNSKVGSPELKCTSHPPEFAVEEESSVGRVCEVTFVIWEKFRAGQQQERPPRLQRQKNSALGDQREELFDEAELANLRITSPRDEAAGNGTKEENNTDDESDSFGALSPDVLSPRDDKHSNSGADSFDTSNNQDWGWSDDSSSDEESGKNSRLMVVIKEDVASPPEQEQEANDGSAASFFGLSAPPPSGSKVGRRASQIRKDQIVSRSADSITNEDSTSSSSNNSNGLSTSMPTIPSPHSPPHSSLSIPSSPPQSISPPASSSPSSPPPYSSSSSSSSIDAIAPTSVVDQAAAISEAQNAARKASGLMEVMAAKLESGQFRDALTDVQKAIQILAGVPDPSHTKLQLTICAQYKLALLILMEVQRLEQLMIHQSIGTCFPRFALFRYFVAYSRLFIRFVILALLSLSSSCTPCLLDSSCSCFLLLASSSTAAASSLLHKEEALATKWRVGALSRQLSKLKLQAKHSMICCRMSVKKNMEAFNFGVASEVLQFILSKNPPDAQDLMQKLMLCKEKGEQNLTPHITEFYYDCKTFGPIAVSGGEGVKGCPHCSATYSALSPDQRCHLCTVGVLVPILPQ